VPVNRQPAIAVPLLSDACVRQDAVKTKENDQVGIMKSVEQARNPRDYVTFDSVPAGLARTLGP